MAGMAIESVAAAGMKATVDTPVAEATEQPDQEVEEVERDEDAIEAEREKARREREARAQALTLEIIGDLPSAEVKPPENVLFVCKLNPVTEDDDLNTIFSRFGPIVSCEVIRDKRTGDSLQYAFIEYENQKDCEQAYFKMPGVLIDDHRIHVDFSQSVSRVAEVWRTKTNAKRAQHGGGGFGGVADLEKKRQYRKMEDVPSVAQDNRGYDMLVAKGSAQEAKNSDSASSRRPRSRSPRYKDRYGRRDDHRKNRERDHEHRRPRDDGYRGHERDRSRDRQREHDRHGRRYRD